MRIEQLKQAFHAFGRNFRWGTCGECPTTQHETGINYIRPELCKNTQRYDHQYDLKSLMEQFALYQKEQDRCNLKNKILARIETTVINFYYNYHPFQELKLAIDNNIVTIDEILDKFKTTLLKEREVRL